jgi:dTDP-4-amino-4,6-dideoxygalactose transaminase|tara:strand:- start:253 stop:1362 length:1110 start_codon:yes stop_codon:yes gene_type:complete
MIPFFIPDMPTTEQLIPYLKEIDNNQWYSNFGPLYRSFQKRISSTFFKGIDEHRMTLVSNGTAAIELALRTLQLKQHAKVLTSSFTFPATIEAILNAGLTPILMDIDSASWQLSPQNLHKVIQEHDISAIIPVATFGIPVDSSSWADISENTGIPVIVDAAPALGNQTIDHRIFYAFSLHTTKAFGIGEGGLVVFPNTEQAEICRKMTNFGLESDRTILYSGTNAKLSEYHCAVGLAQLDRLKDILEKRRQVFDNYMSLITHHELPIRFQPGIEEYIPANIYILFDHVAAKSAFETFKHENIETRRLYYPLINRHTAFKNITVAGGGVQPNSLHLSKRGLALPFHMHLSHNNIEVIISNLAKITSRAHH